MMLLLTGEWQTATALWVVILCLLPAMWVALSTAYLSLKIFCTTLLITQVITVPLFYLQADRYTFGGHRPFGFTALETLPIFLLLGLFLWLTASLVKLSQRVIGRPVPWSETRQLMGGSGLLRALQPVRTQRQTPFVIGIFLLMAISLPVKLWMFDMGIGIVGTPPPSLPYRLSGILTYLFGYIVPLAIGYCFIKTKRDSLLLALLISVYALLIGASATSKGVVLLTTAPIVAFAWRDRRWAIMGISGLLSCFGVMIASASREIVHVADGLTTGSFTELGLLGTLFETLARLEWSWELLLYIFSDIAGRVEGFQGLLLASQFNPEAVGGSWEILIKSINSGWADIGHDAMHLESLGYTIPKGFYNVAASLNAWMLMASNRNFFWVLPFAIYATVTFVILEKLFMRAARKYNLPLSLVQAVIFLVTMWFYTGPGTLESQVLLAVSVFFGLLPALRLGHLSRSAGVAMKKHTIKIT